MDQLLEKLVLEEVMSEREEQVRLFRWAAEYEDEIPELAALFHIPNGGWRHKATAGKLKAEGVKPGVLDLFLPVPNQGYHGLWIEMKWGRNKPTASQLEWIGFLRANDYKVDVCYSKEEAEAVLLSYLDREDLLVR